MNGARPGFNSTVMVVRLVRADKQRKGIYVKTLRSVD
jgi:hypothetical protein